MDISRRQLIASAVALGSAPWPHAAEAARAPEWAQFKGDPQRTGRSRMAAPDRPGVVWQARQRTQTHSELCVDAQGRIYCAGDYGVLTAHAPDGEMLWRQSLHGPYRDSVLGGTVILHDGSVFTVSSKGRMFCFSPSGKKRWFHSANPDDQYTQSSAPLVAKDGTIYIASDHALQAVHPDGRVAWRHQVSVSGPPAEGHDGSIYVPSGQNLLALSPSGQQRWRCRVTSDVYGLDSAPAVGDDGIIYLGTVIGDLFAVDPDGRWRWQSGERGIVGTLGRSPAIGHDGTIYYSSPHDTIHAIHPATGAPIWRYQTDRPYITAHSSPTVSAEGILLVCDSGGRLLALSPAGALLWISAITDSHSLYGSAVLRSSQRMVLGTGIGVCGLDSSG